MNFDSQSAHWDDEKRTKRAKIIAEQIAAAVELKAHDRALEFGCGTGLISFNLYDKVREIVCVDTSKGMIDVLNTKIRQHNIRNMVACHADIQVDDPLVPQYEVVYTSMALHHILDIETTLARLYQLLKPEGALCIVDLDEEDGSFHKADPDFIGHNGFNQQELKQVLAKIGFGVLASHTFYHDTKQVAGGVLPYSLFSMVGRK
jgi:ubiquinone/menaquinone biosynthesis C-methylase UbiE